MSRERRVICIIRAFLKSDGVWPVIFLNWLERCHIPTNVLQDALKEYPKYQLTEAENYRDHATHVETFDSEDHSWLAIYKPILLIFGYIFTVAIIAGFSMPGAFYEYGRYADIYEWIFLDIFLF